MPRKSAQIALGGLCAALSVVLMLASGLLPFSTYALPALAGVVLLPLAVEFGPGTAALAYAAGALLSLFLVPDREASLMYAAFFGYYPILRFRLEKIRSRVWKTALKLLVFNAAVFFVYGLLVFLYGVAFVFAVSPGGCSRCPLSPTACYSFTSAR
jgi:hypothetical protein